MGAPKPLCQEYAVWQPLLPQGIGMRLTASLQKSTSSTLRSDHAGDVPLFFWNDRFPPARRSLRRLPVLPIASTIDASAVFGSFVKPGPASLTDRLNAFETFHAGTESRDGACFPLEV